MHVIVTESAAAMLHEDREVRALLLRYGLHAYAERKGSELRLVLDVRRPIRTPIPLGGEEVTG